MPRAAQLALCILAAVFVADFSTSVIWPWTLALTERSAYLRAAAVCHEAKASILDADINREIGLEASRRLNNSGKVALSTCLEVKILGARLAGAGVSEKYLGYLDALALDRSQASLGYVSNFVAPP